MFPDCNALFEKTKGDYGLPVFFLHFEHYVTIYAKQEDQGDANEDNLESGKDRIKVESKRFKYDTGEILWYNGPIFYKTDTKKVTYIKIPLNFNDRQKYHTIYDSQYAIKKIKIDTSVYPVRFIIADEIKYLKFAELKDDGKDEISKLYIY